MKRIRVAMMLPALVALLALAAPAAFAQGGAGGGQGRGRQMEMLMKDITLTDVQKASADSIVQSFRTQMPAFTPGQPPDSAARAKRMEVMGKQNAAIRAVLTADQQKVFDKNLAEMPPMGRPRP
jgi:Spy/CpxP family protein refolding chaperone